jgi:cytochrome c oxidase assembly protein subunit 15
MPDSLPDAGPSRTIADILTLGFGAAAAMWGVGFLTHLPLGAAADGGDATAAPWAVPGPVVFLLLIAVLVGGGWIGGRISHRGTRAGLWSGALTGMINLLILGAVIRSVSEDKLLAYAALWIPVTILASAALGAIGAALGSKRASRPVGDLTPEPNWTLAFALVTCGATLLLIAVGGTVTGMEAGLAVPDWPNSFGYNMLLLPMAKMTGGIYFEHSHRLLGMLVGLTTLVFATFLQCLTVQRWVKNLALVAFGLVVIQGLLGALRVTGTFTLSQNPDDLAPSLTMGMIHATLAQLLFALLVTIACALSSSWRRFETPLRSPKAANDRVWGMLALATVLAQIIIGVMYRHHGDQIPWTLHLHLTMAVAVLVIATIYSLRMSSFKGQVPAAPRLGKLITHVLGMQFLLGIAALWAVLVEKPAQGPHPVQVLITTLHQTTGALLLATVTATFAWHLRTVRPGTDHSRHRNGAVSESTGQTRS